MTSHPRPLPVADTVPCDVCHKEIPLSEANHFEAEDYVLHFCGLECYSTWKLRSESVEQQREEVERQGESAEGQRESIEGQRESGEGQRESVEGQRESVEGQREKEDPH